MLRNFLLPIITAVIIFFCIFFFVPELAQARLGCSFGNGSVKVSLPEKKEQQLEKLEGTLNRLDSIIDSTGLFNED